MESLIDQILFLQKVPIFKDLTVKELGQIASISESLEYEEGEYLFREGDIGYNAYVIISGSVEIFRMLKNKEKITYTILESGSNFGEMALFEGDVRSASAQTLKNSLIMSYKKEDFDNVILKYPSIAMGIIRVLSKRLRETTGRLQKYEQFFSEYRIFSNRINNIFDKDFDIKT